MEWWDSCKKCLENEMQIAIEQKELYEIIKRAVKETIEEEKYELYS